MHDDPHIADSLRRATPDSQPPASFDVDAIIRNGRRIRRRHRLAIGGASAAGVLAAAGAIAMVMTLSPQAPPAAVDAPPSEAAPPADEGGGDIADTAMAGYPWTETWNYGTGDDDTMAEISTAATEAFGELLVSGGIWDESMLQDGAEECDEDPSASGCDEGGEELLIMAEQRPGNYGQVFTRQYHADAWGDQYAIEHPVFNLDVLLPGGWTAEPGPVTDQLFPKHLISKGAYYTDQAPEFETTDLDDGRTLMTADHGCALDLAIAYPNGTALQLSWEIGCEPGTGGMHPVELDALTEAALEMPEIEYDASELEPVDELWDIPTGWPKDPSWESDASADANAAADGVRDVFDDLYPGGTVDSVIPTENGIEYRGAALLRAYRFGGSLPLETTIDGEQSPVSYEMRYYLPGGWTPGFGNTYHGQPYLLVCRDDEGSTCDETEIDGRTVATEVTVDGDYEVVAFHPDGWALSIWIGSADGAGMELDEAVSLALAFPAPPYDADATPEIPTE